MQATTIDGEKIKAGDRLLICYVEDVLDPRLRREPTWLIAKVGESPLIELRKGRDAEDSGRR